VVEKEKVVVDTKKIAENAVEQLTNLNVVKSVPATATPVADSN